MKRALLFLIVSALLTASAHAQEIDPALFGGYQTAFVLYDRSSGEVIDADPSLSARRVPPCSTFKIYNTLIGLELGLLPEADAPWYAWDGERRALEAWNRDLTLREAFRVSAVPAYQELARQIGEQRMKEYVGRIGYGNQDISAGVDVFWLPREGRSTILISADEQAALLNRLLDGALPFAEENVAVLRDIMRVRETAKGTLYGKTGTGENVDGIGGVGWFVGFVESGGRTYVFACNVTGGEAPSGKAARAIVERVLEARGFM